MNPLDIAHKMVTQQRQLVDVGPRVPLAAVDPIGSVVDVKVSHLAERVSTLVASLQRRCDADKLALEAQVKDLGTRVDGRFETFEARLVACEERLATQDRRLDASAIADRSASDAAMVLREVRSHVSHALTEAKAEWRQQHGELHHEQRHQAGLLDDLDQKLRQVATTSEQVENELSKAVRRSEDQLHSLMTAQGAAPPQWFGQLESALNAVELRLNEQQVTAEMQLSRLRVDMDGLRRHADSVVQSVRDDTLRSVDARLDRQTAAGGHYHAGSPETMATLRENTRRLDDTEARMAALRVRVDAHDGRFSTFGERLEVTLQQADEVARNVAMQQKEEILMESNLQLKMLRQRVESLSELSEELLAQQAPSGLMRSQLSTSHTQLPPKLPPRRGGDPF